MSAAPSNPSSHPPVRPGDPIVWNGLIALAFLLACLVRLGIPSEPFFDEVHYLPAARAVLDLSQATNVEHPPLAKQIIAAGMALFGDEPLGWRIFSVVFGTLALFAAMRAMWFASGTRAASQLTGLFVATNFILFVHARIAMLDVFMVAFLMLAAWMFAAALRENETARWAARWHRSGTPSLSPCCPVSLSSARAGRRGGGDWSCPRAAGQLAE